ncbi:MAG: hypothetical protein K2G24_06860 [Muribaculaceae bacterium]|nr:hypothetical protein [Muribaculaceae bacterium]
MDYQRCIKKFALVLFVIVSLITCSSRLSNQRFDVIDSFNDSINSIIDERKFLYYIRGNYGHVWSLAVQDKDGYILVSGKKRNNDYRIDTITIDEPLLSWGLDTMELKCNEMEPVESGIDIPFHERLVLYSSKKEIIFDCSDTYRYSGPDSVAFNLNLRELKYFMFYNTFPIEYKEKLPKP